MSKNTFMPILATVILASFSTFAVADTLTQSQQNLNSNVVKIGITNDNQALADATANAKASAASTSSSKAKSSAPAPKPNPKPVTPPPKGTGSGGGKSGGETPPPPPPRPIKKPSGPQSSSGAKSGSSATAGANAASTSQAAASNNTKIGISTSLQQTQNQAMSNSGNATLTGSGNSTVRTSNSLKNSGNSTASATTGPVTVGPIANTNSNISRGGSASNGPITMNENENVEAPKIPVSTAASVFVNDCQNGLSMQTKKVGLNSAAESYRCQLLDEANTEFSLAFKSWQQGAIDVDSYIQALEARIDSDREKVVEYEEALRTDSMGKRVGGLSAERIELYKRNIAVLQARIDQWQETIDIQFPFMLMLTGKAQEHYEKGLDYVKQAGFTIKKHKVSGMVAEISNDLMAPFAVTLGVVSAAKQ